MNIPTLPTVGGICLSCEDRDCCPMNDMLAAHKQNVEDFGDDYKDIRTDLWDEDAINEPELDNGNVEWCPMYFCDETTEGNKCKQQN